MLKLNRKFFDNIMAKKQMNANELAQKADLSNATISKLLKENSFASYKTLGKIAKALNIEEPAELIKND
ncbi:helix-turn-helix transcriptional regulator [Megamonas hypermegale]|uniref:helix-turn-helix domain-containing protein n=1 Tax=Megamonas hypermegale TaxID=158847 RepID=UPI0026EC5DA3|nr:helix-turn-helix transcriptional regulator [Megamonas hypermegale]